MVIKKSTYNTHLRYFFPCLRAGRKSSEPGWQKAKGNTLIEVLMSLSIISLLFFMGMGLLQQITGISSPVQQFRTRSILQQQLTQLDFSIIPLQEEIEVQGRKIHRNITWLDVEKEIVLVHVSCLWKEQEIESRKKIVNLKNLVP